MTHRLAFLVLALSPGVPSPAQAPASIFARDFRVTVSGGSPRGDLLLHPPGGSGQLVSFALPEGNHRVIVAFTSAAAAAATTIKAESRRLVVERGEPAAVASVGPEASDPSANSAAEAARTFVVNVRTPALAPPERNAPGGAAVVLNDRERGSFTWDDRLTLELHAPLGSVRRIDFQPADVPTVYLVGDSTVTDQRHEDSASWGQMLPRFLGPAVAVANHAESGETLKSFATGLRLAKVLERMRAGDWLFIQFGHNDQKQQWPQTYAEAGTTYDAWLKVYLAEARRRGATPVLLTSPQRRTFDETGRIRNSHGGYPDAVRRVAAEENVALIDLDRASVALYEALGPERAPRLFAAGGKDATHHNNFGAYQLAQCVAQGIRDARLPLAAHLAADFAGFDPSRPDDPDRFHLPPSPQRSEETPRGN
ncbi:MAG TPA: rhamnogalacturonan acetylesterase [Opitutaceae bacterium]|nr:rhamnogalacturonan acetylesterase [Opitutaceae bacterium]